MTVASKIGVFTSLLETVRMNHVYEIPEDLKIFSICRDALGFYVEYYFRFSKSEDVALTSLQTVIVLLQDLKDSPVEASHMLRNRIAHAYRRTLQEAIKTIDFHECASKALVRLDERDRESHALYNEGKMADQFGIIYNVFVPDWYRLHCGSTIPTQL